MSNFYTILTNIGAALHANAQVQQTTVPWTHMALGDGNGNPVVPQQTQAGLVREVHRLPITSLEQHPDNHNWIVVEAVVPSDVGGWTVRETALYGGAGGGSCIAVGNYPATYKPVLAEGAAREMVMRMVIEVSSVATVKLVIDPAVAIASRKWVESLVATPAKAGLIKLATVDEAKEGQRDDVAVTPEGLDAALDGIGGLPRFTPYLWGGRGDATPGGDAQSSGQQLLDLMYPDMRADVMATQFYCTETDWQADPSKRLTHWSLGELGWMRPPDKNCVQPGSLQGPFFGAGVGSDSALLGTAVLDQLQGFTFGVPGDDSAPYFAVINKRLASAAASAYGTVVMSTAADGAPGVANVSSKLWPVSDGVSGDPRIGAVTRPRTWHGIWMIRMYGRVANSGDLNAPALNARMDMIDARVAALEGRQKSLGDGQSWKDMTAQRAPLVTYTNDTGRTIVLRIACVARQNTREWILIDGVQTSASLAFGNSAMNAEMACEVPDGCTYSMTGASLQKWMELRA